MTYPLQGVLVVSSRGLKSLSEILVARKQQQPF